MEFGLFVQGYIPGPNAHDPEHEHEHAALRPRRSTDAYRARATPKFPMFNEAPADIKTIWTANP